MGKPPAPSAAPRAVLTTVLQPQSACKAQHPLMEAILIPRPVPSCDQTAQRSARRDRDRSGHLWAENDRDLRGFSLTLLVALGTCPRSFGRVVRLLRRSACGIPGLRSTIGLVALPQPLSLLSPSPFLLFRGSSPHLAKLWVSPC